MKLTFYRKTGEKRPFNIVQPPAGTIVAYAGSSAPTGWLVCSGGVVSTSTYPALSDVIKTNFNTSGEGAGNFRLPDFRDKAPIGAGTGTGLTARTLGQSIGSNNVKLTASQSGFPLHNHAISESDHTHTVASDSHRHSYGVQSGSSLAKTGGTNVTSYMAGITYNTGLPNSTPTFTISKTTSKITDGQSPATNNVVGYKSATAVSEHPNVQPSLVVNYIIKT